MPVRKIANHGRNIIGLFPSLKMGSMIAYESLIELDLLYFLDYEREVEVFEEQPLTIDYFHDGKTYRYTPDFHVIKTGQHWLLECKPRRLISSEENQRKFAAAEEWCQQNGWIFAVITEEQLRAGHRLRNVKTLTYYARHNVVQSVAAQARSCIQSSPQTIYDLALWLRPDQPDLAKQDILH